MILLSNELLFENFMKKQHLLQIRRLQRDATLENVNQMNCDSLVFFFFFSFFFSSSFHFLKKNS